MPSGHSTCKHRNDRRAAVARDPHRSGRQRRFLTEEADRQPILKKIAIRQEDGTLTPL
jgi:hypothetical protein